MKFDSIHRTHNFIWNQGNQYTMKIIEMSSINSSERMHTFGNWHICLDVCQSILSNGHFFGPTRVQRDSPNDRNTCGEFKLSKCLFGRMLRAAVVMPMMIIIMMMLMMVMVMVSTYKGIATIVMMPLVVHHYRLWHLKYDWIELLELVGATALHWNWTNYQNIKAKHFSPKAPQMHKTTTSANANANA